MNPLQQAHEEALAAYERAQKELREYRQTWKDVLEGERFLALASVKADTLRIESRVAWEKEQKRLRRAEFKVPPHARPFLEMLADPSVQGSFGDFGFCTRSGIELRAPRRTTDDGVGFGITSVTPPRQSFLATTWNTCRRSECRLSKIWQSDKLVEGHSFQKAADLVQLGVTFANLLAWEKEEDYVYDRPDRDQTEGQVGWEAGEDE